MKITKLMLVAATLLMSVGAHADDWYRQDPNMGRSAVDCPLKTAGNQGTRLDEKTKVAEPETQRRVHTAAAHTSDNNG